MVSPQNASERSIPGLAGGQAERRAHPRFFFQGTAVIRILPYGSDVLGVLLDLSEGGCGIEFGIAIPAQVGTQVEVNLNVRGLTLVQAGVIRRIDVIRSTEKETRAGIQFMETSGRSIEQVRVFMKRLFTQAEMSRQAGF